MPAPTYPLPQEFFTPTPLNLWAFVGDSIVHGVGASNFRFSWVPKVVTAFPGSMMRQDSYEAGVSGQRSAWGRTTGVPAALQQGARRFAIMLGTNDVGVTVPVAEYVDNLTQMLTLIKSRGGVTVVCTPPPRGAGSTADQAKLVLAYRLAILALRDTFDFSIADTYSALLDPATERLYASMDSGDGANPNDLGHTTIAETVAAAIVRDFPLLSFGSRFGRTERGASNGVVDGLGFSTGWFEQPGGTGAAAVQSIVADTSGILAAGSWLQRVVDATAGASNRTLAVTASSIPFASGDVALMRAQIQVEDIAGTWKSIVAAGTGGLGFSLNNGGVNRYNRINRDLGYYDKASNTWNYAIHSFFHGAGGWPSFNLWFGQTLPIGSHVKFRVGNVGLFNATALGIPVDAVQSEVFAFL
jgi:lysophospholipase L1-like esterase